MSLCQEVIHGGDVRVWEKSFASSAKVLGLEWTELDVCRPAEASVAGAEGDVREGKARFQEPYRPKWEFGSQYSEEFLRTSRSKGETWCGGYFQDSSGWCVEWVMEMRVGAERRVWSRVGGCSSCRAHEMAQILKTFWKWVQKEFLKWIGGGWADSEGKWEVRLVPKLGA